MNELWNKASQQVTALSQREKILLLLTGLIIIPGILDFFLLQPLRDKASEWRQQTDIIHQSLSSFSEQQNDLLAEIKKDPAMELERKIEGIFTLAAALSIPGMILSHEASSTKPSKG